MLGEPWLGGGVHTCCVCVDTVVVADQGMQRDLCVGWWW
jgi:hypothetical protein